MIVPCMFVVDGQYGKTGFLNLSHVSWVSFAKRDVALTPSNDWEKKLTPDEWTSAELGMSNRTDVSVVWTPELAAAWDKYCDKTNCVPGAGQWYRPGAELGPV